MKIRLQPIISVAFVALILASCGPAYVSTDRSYYNPSYGYSYGDGLPDGYYYNPQTQAYQYQQTVNVPVSQNVLSFNDFYAQLSPFGVWVNLTPYGQVWIANVPNFQPYSTNGYWTYTNYGWTWVSNYSWGWGPFHYGRWGYDRRYGWYWVPGYEWGPAWVAWSSSGDMYGWAPLMPGMSYNVRLSVNHFPTSYWTFMPGRYMGDRNIGNYYVNRSRNTTIINNNTTIINNYGSENNSRFNMGPSTNDVQRQTGRSVQPMRVVSTADSRNVGVSNDEYRIYRPTGEASSRSSSASEQTNRASSQPITQQEQSSRSSTSQPPARTQTEQSSRSASNQQSAGTQQEQSSRSTATPPARTQSEQSSRSSSTQQEQSSRSTSAQPSRTQSEQSPVTTREYRPTQEQPRVTNRVSPQKPRQIQRAQSDNIDAQKEQQQQQQQQQQSTPQRRSSTSSQAGRR